MKNSPSPPSSGATASYVFKDDRPSL
jgi:hypothetical protein